MVIKKVWFDETRIFIELSNKVVIANPISWFPHLRKGTPEQWEKYELWGRGTSLRWEELDEDLSMEGFIRSVGNKASGEKEVIYIDMDGVIVDYMPAYRTTTEEERRQKGFFEALKPVKGSIAAFKQLSEKYNVYLLSTAPWSNPHAWSEKRIWVEKHLGDYAFKRLILSHNKGLLKGSYLIDDRTENGVDDFDVQHIHFGQAGFENWKDVLKRLL